jgi:hypothetical protein
MNMDIENNILFNLPKIKQLEKNIFVSNRKIKNIINDIFYFYSPSKIIIEYNKITFFINNDEIIIYSTFIFQF